jgi:hypothetical protein
VYRRRDVELAMLVRRLLHDEGLTIAGAKKRLRESGHDRVSSPPDPVAAREVTSRAELLSVREELSALLAQIDDIVAGTGDSEPRPDVRATVTSAMSNSVPVPAKRRI